MDLINRYLSLGWSLIPLEPRSKKPVLPWREFQEKPPGLDRWSLWREIFPVPPHGIAVICGAVSGLIVIDVDDEEAAYRLQTEIPFETPMVKTCRGFHFYFRHRSGISSTAIGIPGIGKLEIKADRSLVTLPPSIHPKGHRYEWVLAPWDVDTLPELPKWLLEALHKRERERELTRQVGHVSFSRPGRKLTPEVLREILTAIRVTITKEIPLGDREGWRLNKCPICGESEGNPWVVSDSGRLFDFRDTCPASRARGGLPLRAWLRELGREDLLENLEVEERKEVPSSDVPVASVEEARRLILEALRGDRDVFLSVPPGVGKSVTTLEWLVREGPRPTVYSVPTHELAEELAEQARALTTEPVVVIKGRSPETCLAWGEAERARRLGYDPGETVCPWCHHNPSTAVMAQKCKFMRQFEALKRNRGIYFASHVLAAHLLKRELRKARIWVLDEDPLKLINQVETSVEGLRTLRAIFPPESETLRLAEKILALGDELHRVVSQTGKGSGRIYPRSPEYGPWAGRKSLAEWLNLDFTALAPKVREEIEQIRKTFGPRKLFNLGVNLHALRWIEEAVGRGACHLAALRDPKRPVVLRRTEILTPSTWKGRVIALDATGYLPVLQRLLDRLHLEELNLQVPVKARTVWVKAAVSKTAVAKEKGHQRALKALQTILEEYGREKTVLFCHKAIKAEVEKLVEGRTITLHHFGVRARGTNRLADCETVILLGLPVPNPASFYDDAHALGLSKEEFEKWLDLIARAESWQEINRIRPVLYPGKTIVVIAPRWPFEPWLGPPQETKNLTVTGGKIAWAVKVLLLWLDVFGFVIMEIALLLGIGREGQIPPEEARSEVWARIRKNFPEKSSKFEEALFSLKDPDTPSEPKKGKQRKDRERSLKGVSRSLNIFIDFSHALKENSQVFLEPPNISPGAFYRSLRLPRVEFKDSSWWRQTFRHLRRTRPDLPIFEVRLKTPGGLQWTRGLGDMQAAQDFYRALGREIDSNSWREVGNV